MLPSSHARMWPSVYCLRRVEGQNQTGPNVVLSEDQALVSLERSVAPPESLWSKRRFTDHGRIRFGPQGRIQRLLVPLPPLDPATESQPFNTPNVLVRCNGTSGFTQDLPGI